MTTLRIAILGWLTALACLVAACGSGTAGSGPSSPPSSPPPPAPTAAVSPSRDGSIEGAFDVGGHRLYLSCQGTGSPTIVYLHGAITNAGFEPHRSAEAVQHIMSEQYRARVCVYDRRNLGRSDTVDAVQRPEDAMNDLHALLAAAKVKPPHVLLGASFGGLLSYLYANTYSDEVVGMVLLDSMFPDELSLESLVPAEERYVVNDEEDEEDEKSLERISHYQVLKAAERYIGKEPKIPVTYLASIPEGFDRSDLGEEYNAKIGKVQQRYVDRFSPGTLKKVDVPHYMEPVIPDRIAEELRLVIAATR